MPCARNHPAISYVYDHSPHTAGVQQAATGNSSLCDFTARRIFHRSIGKSRWRIKRQAHGRCRMCCWWSAPRRYISSVNGARARGWFAALIVPRNGARVRRANEAFLRRGACYGLVGTSACAQGGRLNAAPRRWRISAANARRSQSGLVVAGGLQIRPPPRCFAQACSIIHAPGGPSRRLANNNRAATCCFKY